MWRQVSRGSEGACNRCGATAGWLAGAGEDLEGVNLYLCDNCHEEEMSLQFEEEAARAEGRCSVCGAEAFFRERDEEVLDGARFCWRCLGAIRKIPTK